MGDREREIVFYHVVSTQTLCMSEKTAMKCQRVSLFIFYETNEIVSYTRSHTHTYITYTCTHTSTQAKHIDFIQFSFFLSLFLCECHSFVYREPYAELYTGAQNHTNTTLNDVSLCRCVCMRARESAQPGRDREEREWMTQSKRYRILFSTILVHCKPKWRSVRVSVVLRTRSLILCISITILHSHSSVLHLDIHLYIFVTTNKNWWCALGHLCEIG